MGTCPYSGAKAQPSPAPASSAQPTGCPFVKMKISRASEDGGPNAAPPKPAHEQAEGACVKEAARAAGCPFHAQIPSGARQEDGGADQKGGGDSAGAAAASKCPYLAAATGSSQPSTPSGSEAPKCPLGFTSGGGGGGRQQRLSAFHCVVCKSMLYDCVSTACGHRYCRACIERFSDCPLCGADVGRLTPAPDVQAAVELYIDTHAEGHSIWELEGLAAPAGTAGTEPRGRANFLLQLGLRSLAGGNVAGGEHRLQQCRTVLEEAGAESGAEKSAENSAEGESSVPEAKPEPRPGAAPDLRSDPTLALATVRGCLGDCARSRGAAREALDHYAAGAALLESAARGDCPETQQTLSVMLNKVAELHHSLGNVAAALPFYERALSLRQAAAADCDAGRDPAAWVTAQLALATSLVKTADAQAAAGRGGDADGCMARAADALGTLRSAGAALDRGQEARCAALEAYLEAHSPKPS